jgi:hypothetical protein
MKHTNNGNIKKFHNMYNIAPRKPNWLMYNISSGYTDWLGDVASLEFSLARFMFCSEDFGLVILRSDDEPIGKRQ